MNRWYTYVLQCADGTLYTGITTGLERRVAEHNGDDRLGARYTRSRRPVTLLYAEEHASRAEAARREAAIKKLPAQAKRTLACPLVPAESTGALSDKDPVLERPVSPSPGGST